MLATWFLGSEAGHAVADVLSGRCNPSGRLPVSWPVDVGQIPIFHARRPTGRPADPAVHYSARYLDLPIEPLFPFGHGLSYTRFTLSRTSRAEPSELPPDGDLTVEIEVTNEGPRRRRGDPVPVHPRPGRDHLPPAARAQGHRPNQRSIPASAAASRSASPPPPSPTPAPTSIPRLDPGVIELLVGPTASLEQLLGVRIRVAV